MKKIITAIGNKNLNEKLKEEKEFEIITEDIQYREGILEFLEKQKEVDFLILSELLPGEIDIKNLITKIKLINSNIQIILFLENKQEELENYLYAKGIYSIFYHNQIEVEDIVKLLKNEQKNVNQEMQKQIDELKKMVLEKENKRKHNPNKLSEKYILVPPKEYKIPFFKRRNKNIENHKNEVICISGSSGVGKSIFSVNLAKSLMPYRSKILLIDFDVLNNSLHTILGIKKYPEKIKQKIKNNNLLKEMQIEELIMKINSRVDLIAGINLLFDSKYKISSVKIKTILDKLKTKYEVIIIDTSAECFFEYTKEIMKNSNLNIFITEANLLEIKKAKNLLNIYINTWEIEQKNFNIVFNKYGKNSIDISILKNIFAGFTILGKLSNDPSYDLLINRNSVKPLENKLQEEYFVINQKLLKEKLGKE